MNRRDFLRGTLFAGAVGLAHELDLDRLLWVRGEKTIFLPPVPDVRVDDWVIQQAMKMLAKNQNITKFVDRYYRDGSAQLGSTIKAERPVNGRGGTFIYVMPGARLTGPRL